MSNFDNELKGVLFKNDNKETSSHPDYKGSATIDGVEYFLSSWINTSNAGTKYMSLKFNPKDSQFSQRETAVAATDDSESPF